MSKQIALITTGSRAYLTHFENSDLDQIEIFVVPWEDLHGFKNDYPVVNEVKRYEIGEFMDNIVRGDIMCHQALWSPSEAFKYRHDVFSNLIITNRRTFITKEILEKWYYHAEFLFKRSVRIGEMHVDNRTILDFLSFTSNQYRAPVFRPFTKVLEEQRFEPGAARYQLDVKNMAIFKSQFGEDFYDLYELYRAYDKNKFHGMINDNNELSPQKDDSDRSNTFAQYRGTLKYDSKGHKEHLGIKKMIYNSRVANGYTEKSMYHAFRIISTATHYIKYATLPVQVPNIAFLKDIRRSNYGVKDLILRFEQHKSEFYQVFEKYEDEPKPNINNLAKNIVKQARDAVKTKKEVFHSPAY